jgi:hypothetical protein
MPVAVLVIFAGVTPVSSWAADGNAINFSRDIRPLLSDHCFACHGPDEHQRESGVRLDTAEGIASVIDSDDWESSSLVARIRTDDPDMLMPPPSFHKPLSDQAKTMLEAWIRGGAEFQAHWAFIAPLRKEPPTAPEKMRRDLIDRWIDVAIEDAGLSANGPADRHTLARRVALDLTGLPPTMAQVQSFVEDSSPDAYERLVDSLLAAPAYGEHMARYWLDLVRYGDTHGLHLDNYREMWPYRDWVINALNANKPMDAFITEQLAGDLFPNAELADKVASGFNRLNVTTSEGGSIYDEVFARNVIDRTDAFGTIFLGLTTGCAVCHDHKFDPITQKDYYSLSAFFNSLDGNALDGNAKNHPPVVSVASAEQTNRLEEIAAELVAIDEQLQGPLEEVDAAQREWQALLASDRDSESSVLTPQSVMTKSGTRTEVTDDASVRVVDKVAGTETIEIVCELPPGQWRVLQLDALTDAEHTRVGTASNGNAVLSEISLQTRQSADGEWAACDIASAVASRQQDDVGFAVKNAIDGSIDVDRGWAVAGHENEGGRTAWFRLKSPLVVSQEQPTSLRVVLHYQSKYAEHLLRDVRLTMSDSDRTVDPSQQVRVGDVHVVGPLRIDDVNSAFGHEFAAEKADKFDPDAIITSGERQYRWQHRGDVLPVLTQSLPALSDQASVSLLHQSLHSPHEQTIGLQIGSDAGYVVYFNGKEIVQTRASGKFDPLINTHELKFRSGENHLVIKQIQQVGRSQLSFAFASAVVELPERLISQVASLATDASIGDGRALQRFYRTVYCDAPQWLAIQDLRRGLLKMQTDINKEIPTTLVWKETAEPRQARLLQRGQYDAPGEAVPRAVPSFLPPLPGAEANDSKLPDRLLLAKWLIADNHPLTARVAVNRFWQQVFGTGIVKTSEDFGSQGTPPSHPELLDMLAIDFRESGWDIKAFMKRLVMTDAYQRDAKASETMLRLDPNNRLLARGPRFRLDAEVLRDQMLCVSGLLVNQVGGPSVKPPQPAGLWEAVGYTDSDTAVFVADEGDKIYRRSVYTFWKRTSSPAVMSIFDAPSRESCTARRERTNTPLQALLMLNEPQTLEASRRLATETIANQTSPEPKIQSLFERVVLRSPEDKEQQALTSLLTDLTQFYSNEPDQASALVGSTDADLAAWTVVANTLLNLDEVVSK